ncbi:MAG: ORF6N domain-containing protein [Kiritimatiellae bacterium]|nr:ORF6N domain-containing protein [Kiritimatiellia bacterium]
MAGEPSPAEVVPAVGADDFIKSRIFAIRGVQVMLDRDLAVLYGVETRVLNQAVKRNAARFPPNFMFQLSAEEAGLLRSQPVSLDAPFPRSQFVTLKKGRGSNVKYLPYAFTEQGVAMLSAVLRSATAVEVSVRIMNVFVAMRKALASMAPMLARLETVERRQIADQQRNEERFDTIFKAMDGGDFPPQKVFFGGKHYDAFSFARKLVRKAAKSIVLVDNYCDDTTLDILSQKRGGASVTIATTAKSASKFLTPAAVAKFNKQNPPLAVKAVAAFHDRFLILDGTELYHFDASLKDLGRQYCAVTQMDPMFIPSILQRI